MPATALVTHSYACESRTVNAVWYRARADLRRGVWGTLALIGLIGFAGGVTLAAVAGSIRTRDALPEFLAYNRAPNAGVFVDPTLPEAEQRRLIGQVTALPEWEAVAVLAAAVVSVRPPGENYSVMVANALRDGSLPLGFSRPIIVDGREPDPTSPTDAVVNEAFANAFGIGVGDSFALRSITADRLEAAGGGQLRSDPDGTDVTMTVTGIERQPRDLQSGAQDQQGTVFGSDTWSLLLTPAFWESLDGDVASYGGGAVGRLRPGVTTAQLGESVAAISPDGFFVEPTDDEETIVASIGRAADFEANALLLFAVVLAVAGIALVGQAIGRQVTLRLDDGEALRATGFARRQRAAVIVPRTVLLAVAGAAVAIVVAVALSPLAPVGLARRAELHPGFDVDAVVLAVGAVLIAALVVAWSGAVAWRTSRAVERGADIIRRDRPSMAGARLAAAGAGVTAVAGVRLALERGRGRTAVPVVSALLGGAAGVFMVAAVLTFSFSLDRLIDSPALQGWTWDVVVGNYSQQASVDEGAALLEANPLVGGYLGENNQVLRIDGTTTYVASLGPGDSSVGPPVITGRRPDADDEIALGRTTLADLGKEIGDSVVVSADVGGEPVEATVVGTMILPASINDTLTLGAGGVMTLEGLQAVYGPQGEASVAQQFLVEFADGVDPADGEASLRGDFGDSIITSRPPADVENLRRVQGLPALLAATVGLLALGTLANTLVTCIRRRRRDLATFATLGFRPRQIASTVAWQATTIAVIALVLGLPLGIAAGRTVWALIMTSIGTSVPAVTPWGALAALALAVIVGANAIAALPARAAARTHPATTLRSE